MRRSKSFLTPTATPFARTGSVTVRSTVRPPGSADIDDQLRLQRPGRVGVGQVDRELGMALGVGRHLVGKLGLDRGEVVVGEARNIAGEAGERAARDRLKADRAGDVEAARRRAIEEARVERQRDRLARRR